MINFLVWLFNDKTIEPKHSYKLMSDLLVLFSSSSSIMFTWFNLLPSSFLPGSPDLEAYSFWLFGLGQWTNIVHTFLTVIFPVMSIPFALFIIHFNSCPLWLLNFLLNCSNSYIDFKFKVSNTVIHGLILKQYQSF